MPLYSLAIRPDSANKIEDNKKNQVRACVARFSSRRVIEYDASSQRFDNGLAPALGALHT